MTSKRKKIGLIFIIVFGLALAGFFYAKHVVHTKFDTFVENLPKHIDLQYDSKEVDILFGNLKIIKPLLTIRGKVTNEINAQIKLETFEINDISYWELYNNDAIDIESVIISQPNIIYYHNKQVEGQSYNDIFKDGAKKTFRIGNLEINEANVEVLNVENDSLIFSSENLNIQLSSVASSEPSNSNLPFVVEDFLLNSSNLKYQVSAYENLFINQIDIDTDNSKFSEVSLQTKYSKEELSKLIEVERDHFDLSVVSVEIKNQALVTKKESPIGFKASDVIFNTLNLNIYRDKLVVDDFNHKSLYSKMLRELNFSLDLSNVFINNGLIVYEEKVKADNNAGKLEFSNLDAKINNVSNTYKIGNKTTIDITANFMENTPLKVDWNFDVNDVNDTFIFKADLGNLKADHLNQFMQPNLNIKLEGELLKTYFTVGGNANTSTVNLKTDYDQFDVVILKEDGKEKNKFLSGLVNLFISKDSKDDSNDFRESDTETVERDKTKSVFNFVWKNARAGLLSAMVGDGEKDD
nr:hypothetical protein [uncultured Psychroserpens sp.]